MKKRKGDWSVKYQKCIICWWTSRIHASKWKCALCNRLYPDITIEAPKQTKAEKALEIMNLIEKVKYRQKHNIPCLEMILDWKSCYFPFRWIEKKAVHRDKEYEEYREKLRQFTLLKEFYELKTIKKEILEN